MELGVPSTQPPIEQTSPHPGKKTPNDGKLTLMTEKRWKSLTLEQRGKSKAQVNRSGWTSHRTLSTTPTHRSCNEEILTRSQYKQSPAKDKGILKPDNSSFEDWTTNRANGKQTRAGLPARIQYIGKLDETWTRKPDRNDKTMEIATEDDGTKKYEEREEGDGGEMEGKGAR